MANYYSLLSPSDPTNGTTQLRFEGDNKEVKTISVGVPIALSAEEVAKIGGYGFMLEKSTKADAESVAVTGQPLAVGAVGADVAEAEPSVGDATTSKPSK